MDKTETLKPCPWCGAMPAVLGDREGWIVTCEDDDCPINPISDTTATEAEAIAVWNTRTPRPDNALADDAVDGVAQLRDVVMPVISACLLMRSDDPKLAHPRLGVAAEVANAVAKHLSALCSTPPEADLRAENEALREVLGRIDALLTCGDGRDHYCPNCDNTTFEAQKAVRQVLKGQTP